MDILCCWKHLLFILFMVCRVCVYLCKHVASSRTDFLLIFWFKLLFGGLLYVLRKKYIPTTLLCNLVNAVYLHIHVCHSLLLVFLYFFVLVKCFVTLVIVGLLSLIFLSSFFFCCKRHVLFKVQYKNYSSTIWCFHFCPFMSESMYVSSETFLNPNLFSFFSEESGLVSHSYRRRLQTWHYKFWIDTLLVKTFFYL